MLVNSLTKRIITLFIILLLIFQIFNTVKVNKLNSSRKIENVTISINSGSVNLTKIKGKVGKVGRDATNKADEDTVIELVKTLLVRVQSALEFISTIAEIPSDHSFLISWDKFSVSEIHILKKLESYLVKALSLCGTGEKEEERRNIHMMASMMNEGFQCNLIQQQQQTAISKVVSMDICSEIEWYKLAQIAWPEAKSIIDVGGNKGYLGSLFLSLWGGGGYGLSPAEMFSLSKKLKSWPGSRNPAGYCKDGYNHGLQLYCPPPFDRNLTNGHCNERKLGLKVYSFDGSSYLKETVDDMITTHSKDPLLKKREVWEYYHTAISDIEGIVKFTKQSKLQNAGFEGGKMNHGTDTEDVNMTTIDRFIERNDIKYLDILKIDAEGNDNKVLLGANESIKTKVGIFTFEGGRGVTFSKDMVMSFDSLGYSCYSTSRAGLFKWNGQCMVETYMGGYIAKDKGNVFCVNRIRAPLVAFSFDVLSFPLLITETFSSRTDILKDTFDGSKPKAQDKVYESNIFGENKTQGLNISSPPFTGSSNLYTLDLSVISKAYVNIKPFCRPWPTCLEDRNISNSNSNRNKQTYATTSNSDSNSNKNSNGKIPRKRIAKSVAN